MIIPQIGQPSTEYQIQRSLRFRSGASAFLSRTPAVAGNQQKFTFSTWLKIGSAKAGVYALVIQARSFATSYDVFQFSLSSDGDFALFDRASDLTVYANAVTPAGTAFRDTSAWYHVMLVIDTTLAVSSDRVKIYVNGNIIPLTGTFPPQNYNMDINTQIPHYIGQNYGNSIFHDGYLADVNFIDGQALTPTSFGEYDSFGNWKAKKYGGTYGTNGFYLDFSDTSGLSKNLVTSAIITAPNGGVAESTIVPDTTYFVSNSTAGSALTFLQWDFGSSVNLSSAYLGGLYFTNNASSGLELSSSNDGTNWTAFSSFNVSNSGSNYTATFSVRARYVRLRMVSFGSNGQLFVDQVALRVDSVGVDASGSGNNWTANNISLTPGVTYDSMFDVPLGGGGGELGNYATLNPNISSDGAAVYSTGNLTISGVPAYGVSSTIPVSAIKTYWEVLIGANASQDVEIGIHSTVGAPVSSAGGYGWGTKLGRKWDNFSATTGYSTATVGDIVAFTYDNMLGQLDIYKNGILQFSITGIPIGVDYWVAVSGGGVPGNDSYSFNFGQRPFAYTPPDGFKALHTGKLTDPTITNPKQHFDIKLRAGTSGSVAITGLQFQPGLIWPKARNDGFNHYVYDSVRGAQKELIPNSTVAESTQTRTLLSFDSLGYTLGDDADSRGINMSAHIYVDWLWKAGGAPVTNSAGSITSQVSANPSAGFSIVTYACTGANATVGHGLGIAPKMIINRARNAPSAWVVYHASTGNSGALQLQSTSSFTSFPDMWNNTTPSSSVFTIGTDGTVNTSGSLNLAYCFSEIAGYSKFGSYTGNGSTDGPFVYCGFRPRFMLVKRTDAASNWAIYDTTRDTYNASVKNLNPDLAASEGIGYDIDILSNGFKQRIAGGYNANGGTYIFMAIAEAPFKYALAR